MYMGLKICKEGRESWLGLGGDDGLGWRVGGVGVGLGVGLGLGLGLGIEADLGIEAFLGIEGSGASFCAVY
jgi:hypothetical protein